MLSTRRPRGMEGVQPIPMGEMRAYLRIFGAINKEEFVYHMIAMDSALLEVVKLRSSAPKMTAPKK